MQFILLHLLCIIYAHPLSIVIKKGTLGVGSSQPNTNNLLAANPIYIKNLLFH